MSKKILGMEIGSFCIKLADCAATDDERIYVANVPDNLVQGNRIVSWDAMAEFIRETIKTNNISAKNVALAIPKDQVFCKRVVMPLMTKDQLNINLPFEFHDYLSDDKDKYVFDYSVAKISSETEEASAEMDILAVAAEKELMENYKTMLHRAGLKPHIIAPEFSAFRNIIKAFDERQDTKGVQDYVIVDIGHNSIKLHFFDKGEYEITRVMEMGVREIDEYIAGAMDLDIHTANMYKEADKDGVLESPECAEIYNRIAVEVMRVMNFYNFNHSENNIEALYCCGGGAMISGLLNAIRENTDMDVLKICQLFETEYEDDAFVLEGALALGIALE